MDGLIFLIILIPLAILILLIIILTKNYTQEQSLDSIRKIVTQLKDQLNELNAQLKNADKKDVIKPGVTEVKKETARPWIKPEPLPDKIILPEEQKPVIIEQPKEKQETPVLIPPLKEEISIAATTAISAPAKKPGDTAYLPDEKIKDGSKTDWEKFIGENLANKIGIAVLVLGISFFVKFAIDQNWINETGRVIIGLVAGSILIALAHRIRNAYRSFSSVLVGGGLTVFYFTIAFAFHQYHLMSQEAAFAIMVIITAFAVVLSILYDRIELAVLATIGGFITPFLVSTGENNYVSLFTYLSILNSGLLVLSWFRRWKAINIIALFFTVFIYGGWLLRQLFDHSEPFPYSAAIFFATVFYFLSIAMNIVNNLRLNIKFGAFDFILLLGINFLYYSAGITILGYWNNGEFQGLFTAALGIVNLVLAWIFFKQKRADKNFIYLLIGLTVTFISLTGPVQLKGNQITLFWAAETVLLFWLYQRSQIVLLKIASALITIPLSISLFMDWSQVYMDGDKILPVIANRGFITTIITSMAFLLYYMLVRKETGTHYIAGIKNRLARNVLLTAGILLGYLAGTWEIYYQFMTRLPGTLIYALYLQLYSFSFVIFILIPFRKSSSFILLKLMLTIAAMAFYIFSLPVNYELSTDMLTTGRHSVHFIAHWASVVLLGWLLYDLIAFFRTQHNVIKDYKIPIAWIGAGCVILLLSVETYHIFMWSAYSYEKDWEYWNNLFYKAGLSILWGLCSFVMMWLGMKHKFKTLRIISLSLFTVTIVKLFLYDIQNIPPGGKIAAFILLGVLLLIVSFMYQRLKKIIIDDQHKE